MPKSLVIAEKPSVAADLARALGRIPKKNDVFEDDKFVITSAIGHLVELRLPGEMDKKRGKWSFANLPIIPDHFELKPIEKTQARFNLIRRLLKRSDVNEIINACDAGREGELIFHYILKLAGTKKLTRRLWLQSMTPEAIREGFANLRSGSEMQPLADAAVCRSESDWLVGINGTRAMTAFNSKGGGFQLTPVGRVQTPTLAILAEREVNIRDFQPRTYFEVFGDFAVLAAMPVALREQARNYRGRWFDENFKKNADEDARPERIWDKQKAQAIASKCVGKPGTIEEEKKPSSQISPLLYDLTTLQREANSRFSLSARRTLQIVQALYEKHKVLTYPRTDSRYLPEDYVGNAKAVLTKFENPELARHAQKALAQGWVKPNKRIFNDAKVTDHHAIIPTGVPPKNLDDVELKIFDMVARRLIAVFYPAAQFEVTTRITRVEGEAFKSEGKIIIDPGWLAVYGKQAAGENEQTLCPVAKGEKAKTEKIEITESQTKPPARFTEGTLLSAMEAAGKLIEDEELREAMSQRGLGTPATRAQIIEGLLLDGYVNRQGRDLIVTQKGLSLINLLRGIGIQALTSPEMTGDWEFKLKQMEHDAMPRPEFMNGIRSFAAEIVAKAKNFSGNSVEGQFMDLEAKCPRCGAIGFKESYKAYQCKACGLVLWKNMAGRELEREEIKSLLEEGTAGQLEGFRSKLGRPFSAVVRLDGDFKQVFDFGDAEKANREVLDFSKLPAIGPCSVCNSGTVHDTGSAYQCSNTTGCKFRMGKTICQREIPREQVAKLIETGTTDLIPRFISRKGKPFSAFLKLDGGKVGFEFEERKTVAKKRRPKSPAAQAAA
jgi:DNA topoisomerase III